MKKLALVLAVAAFLTAAGAASADNSFILSGRITAIHPVYSGGPLCVPAVIGCDLDINDGVNGVLTARFLDGARPADACLPFWVGRKVRVTGFIGTYRCDFDQCVAEMTLYGTDLQWLR